MKDLRTLPAGLRKPALAFMLVLTCGVTVGLVLVFVTTRASVSGMVERFNGSQVSDPSEILTHYPKPLLELLITTHSHVITFALIFLAVGILFYGVRSHSSRWKTFWMTEPFVSTATTFGGMWLMRYVHPGFAYLVLASSALLYFSFYWMAAFIVYELLTPDT